MLTNYTIWGFILLLQNFSFTMVSRARNSASLARHIYASLLSNGVWMTSMMFMVGPMLDNLRGTNGILVQVMTGAFYTVLTVTGSVLAHKYALMTENGKGAVGASDKYVQITKEEYAYIMEQLKRLENAAPVVNNLCTTGYKKNGLRD